MFAFKHFGRCPIIRSPLKNSSLLIVPETFSRTTSSCSSFKFSDLVIDLVDPSRRQQKPDSGSLVFGKQFSDHMFEVQWNSDEGWGIPRICPFHTFNLHPAAKVFHYAQELFEGLKAFHGVDGKIRLFRPQLNVQRMLKTAERASLPTFDGDELMKCLRKLISIEREWVPKNISCSLYIRPTMIGIEPSLGVASSKEALLYIITGPVGPYFATGVREPVSLLADPKHVRAWPGGIGNRKMGANYASTIYVQRQAEKKKFQQVLWLYGEEMELTEVGTMNIFIFFMNRNGEKELVTPPLDGTILPGVVRQSVLDLARKWNEFKVSERSVTMKEVMDAEKENRLLEIFGTGTACVICPVGSITCQGQVIKFPSSSGNSSINERLFEALNDIQTGKVPSDWTVNVD